MRMLSRVGEITRERVLWPPLHTTKLLAVDGADSMIKMDVREGFTRSRRSHVQAGASSSRRRACRRCACKVRGYRPMCGDPPCCGILEFPQRSASSTHSTRAQPPLGPETTTALTPCGAFWDTLKAAFWR